MTDKITDTKKSNFSDVISMMREAENINKTEYNILDEDAFPASGESESSSDPTSELPKPQITSDSITSVVNQLSQNTQDLPQMMSTALQNVTPEMIEQAKSLAAGLQGKQVQSQLNKKGVKRSQIRRQVKNAKKEMNKNKQVDEKMVVIITEGRKVKNKRIASVLLSGVIGNIVNSDSPVEKVVTHLSIGPWKNEEISIWHNGKTTSRNRRASKIAKMPISGPLVIVAKNRNINMDQMIEVERIL